MNKKWLFGKNILISGASGGIGFYMAKEFIKKHGCNVYAVGRSEDKLLTAKGEIDKEIFNIKAQKRNKITVGNFEYLVYDVTKEESWIKIKNELESKNVTIDLLINNAGVMLAFDKFENQDLSMCQKVMETNFNAHLYSYKTFIKDLKSVKGGIVNISSSSALCSVVGAAVYSASKAAVKNFTEAISVEHRNEIYVSYVCPGYTLTDLFRNETEMGTFVKKFAMNAEKMSKKIVSKVARKKKRIVIGIDAHLMSGLYRIFPNLATRIVGSVLKNSGDKMFEKVFRK